jgi:integrase/recombinase XerD
VHAFLSVFSPPRNLRPPYNIAPTRLGKDGKRELVSMRWGFEAGDVDRLALSTRDLLNTLATIAGLLDAPPDETIKIKRDRAILSTLLFHALRREELCKLKVRDFRHARKGVPQLKVSGKGGETRYIPLHPWTHGLINHYLDAAGRGTDENGALFRPIRNNRTRRLERAITADGVYKLLRAYSTQLGLEIGANALRATPATNTLNHEANIAKVQECLGHANIATTHIYDHRRTRPEDSQTFKVTY